MSKIKIITKDLDLGIRKVSTMNFSKVVTLPKTFTENYLSKNMEVNVSMSQDGRLILTPVKTKRRITK